MHLLRSTVGAAASYFAVMQGDPATGIAYFRCAEADEVEHDPAGAMVAVPYSVDDRRLGRHPCRGPVEEQRWARATGDRFWLVVGALQEAAQGGLRIARGGDTPEREAAMLEQIREAAALTETLGNPSGIAYTAMTLGGASSAESTRTRRSRCSNGRWRCPGHSTSS